MSEEKLVPILLGFYEPFRLVLRDTDTWDLTLDDINANEYDYVKLNVSVRQTPLFRGLTPLDIVALG